MSVRLDDLRQEIEQADDPRVGAEIDDAERPDFRIAERLRGAGGLSDGRCLSLFGGQSRGYFALFRSRKPARTGRVVRQPEISDHAEDDRRQAFQQKHRAPASDAEHVRMGHQPCGHRCAEYAG
jgi:hypothetical protein